MRSLHTKLLAAAAIVFAACIALLATSPAAGQSSGPEVAFDPPASTAAIGATVPVDLTVANVPAPPGLGGYDITLSFNPAVVRLDSFDDTGFIKSGTLTVACAPAPIDNVAGTARVICAPIQFFGTQGVGASSPVALIHASFTALAPGTSALSLAGSTLVDQTDATLPATFDSGSIVVEAPTPVPSASPRPTVTPGSATATPPSPTETALAIQPAASAPAPPGGASIAADTTTSRGTQLVAPTTGTGPRGSPSNGLRAIGIACMVAALAVLVSGGAIRLRSQSQR